MDCGTIAMIYFTFAVNITQLLRQIYRFKNWFHSKDILSIKSSLKYQLPAIVASQQIFVRARRSSLSSFHLKKRQKVMKCSVKAQTFIKHKTKNYSSIDTDSNPTMPQLICWGVGKTLFVSSKNVVIWPPPLEGPSLHLSIVVGNLLGKHSMIVNDDSR